MDAVLLATLTLRNAGVQLPPCRKLLRMSWPQRPRSMVVAAVQMLSVSSLCSCTPPQLRLMCKQSDLAIQSVQARLFTFVLHMCMHVSWLAC